MNKTRLAAIFGTIAAITSAFVASRGGHSNPTPQPWPSVEIVASWQATCKAVMLEHRQREMTQSELAGCEGVARRGGHVEQLREWVDALPADPEPPKPPAPTLLRVRTDGRFFVTDAGTFRPVFASALSILTKDDAQRAAVLDEDAALGFNGVRVFGGALAWAGQSAELARERLPLVLTEAAQRGLYVQVAAITDSGTGYDVTAHLRAVAAICAEHAGCVLEIANEFDHPSQSKNVNDPAWLRQLAHQVVQGGLLWALGASIATDEGDNYPGNGGGFVTAHLDRGRDKWNQVRRLREIAGLSEAGRVPAMSGEPIGAAEAAQQGKRENDPAFFFAMGALCRGFELGCVFHSDSGLNGQTLGPVQRQCAEAFIAGVHALSTDARLIFQNATWGGSPVASADFTKVARAYSFVTGGNGWTVLVGRTADPGIQWGGGWHPAGVVAERPGVQVIEIRK